MMTACSHCMNSSSFWRSEAFALLCIASPRPPPSLPCLACIHDAGCFPAATPPLRRACCLLLWTWMGVGSWTTESS